MATDNLTATIFKRECSVYKERKQQWKHNLLAIQGGRAYIDARLCRFPNESDYSWTGNQTFAGVTNPVEGAIGRKDRAALINDAGRIAGKINQYLFKTGASREGIDHSFELDVDGSGAHINRFFEDASEMLTANGFFWVQVDRAAPKRDAEGNEVSRTLAEKLQDKDRPKWRIWSPLSIPAWKFGADGKLDWLILETGICLDSDPRKEEQEAKLRTLFERTSDGVLISEFCDKPDFGLELRQRQKLSVPEIPFIAVGNSSAVSWWFDDVEQAQAQMLNLDSLHAESMIKSVYPQPVFPSSVLSALESRLIEEGASDSRGNVSKVTIVREITRGLENPIFEAPEDKGISRHIMPDPEAMKIIPAELARKRALLFDNAGLALFNKETRQVQTAESKQFDQLDTESTLKNRSLIMQETEQRLIDLSVLIDSTFKAYTPVWPSSFDVVDTLAASQSIQLLMNLPGLTLSMRKLAMHGVLRTLEELGGSNPELISSAKVEIDSIQDTETINLNG
jgi:hypothetical protein